ncbi:MAG: polyprenyl synthetase family protein [Methylacidiphilales bacterium]|nr:polyprenyl synthetase family protein [Candidatus Methylacidiphilales bacterium]
MDVLTNALQQVDQIIINSLTSNVKLINDVSKYIFELKGKRVRTKLALLAGLLFNPISNQSLLNASAIELLHTATLLHDDVIDESTVRRKRKTTNDIWGNSAAVLSGDYLYAIAFTLLIKTNSLHTLKIVSDSAKNITEAEVLQLSMIKNFSLQEKSYLEIIAGKTAALFSASMQSGAHLGQCNKEQEELCAQFGYRLGLAFQLIDDCLDYCGTTETWTKNTGDDLSEGKITLPLIYFLQDATPSHCNKILALLQSHDPATIKNDPYFNEVVHEVSVSAAIKKTYTKAENYISSAMEVLMCLPDTTSRSELSKLASESIKRVF